MPAQPCIRSPRLEAAAQACKPVIDGASRLARWAYGYVTVQTPDINADYDYTDAEGKIAKVQTESGRHHAFTCEVRRREMVRQCHVINVVVGGAAAALGYVAARIHTAAAAVTTLVCLKAGSTGKKLVEQSFTGMIAELNGQIRAAEAVAEEKS